MGLTKQQLEALNVNSFPNNNSGYITPDILRQYNDAVIVNTVNQDVYTADSASFDYRLDNFNPDNLVTTATFNAYTSSNNTALSSLSQSYIAFTASYYQTSASFDYRINNFNPSNIVGTASFNAYTASTNAQLQALEAATGSYITTGSITSNQTINGNLVLTTINTYATQSTLPNRNSQNGATLYFLAADIATAYPSLYDIYALGSSVWSTMKVNGGSLSNAPVSNMILTGSNMYVTLGSGLGVSGSTYTLTGPLPQDLTITVDDLIVSGNIVTNGEIGVNTISASSGNTVSFTSPTASFNSVKANNISSSLVLGGTVNAVSGNFNYITADSASITYLKVIYQTSSVVYSSGSNILGDNANDDIQTLIGRTIVTGSFEVTGSSKVGVLTASAANVSGLNYPTADGAYASQTLQTNGAGVLSFGDVQTTYDTIRNGETTTLVAGTPVYISGSNGANPIVYRADAGNPAKMPVTYVVSENILSGGNGRGITLGHIEGIDLTGYAAGTSVYVAVGGGWTATRPTGSATIQFLGLVTKTGNGGKGLVLNPGPATLPNLTTGNIWVGDSNSYPTTLATASLATTASVNTLSASIYQTDVTQSYQIVANALTASNALTTYSSSQSTLNNTLSSSIANTSSSLGLLTSSFIATSSSLNVVSSSLNVVSSSAYTVSGSYNTMSASAVSNVTDTYTSQPLAKYIVTLTASEYNAIVTKDVNTLYIII